MRDTLGAGIFLIGMPIQMIPKAREFLEVKNGLKIVGAAQDISRGGAALSEAETIVCFCETAERFRLQAMLLARYGANVIGCVKAGGISAEEAGAYAVIETTVSQTPRQIEEMLTRIVYLVRSARLKSRLSSMDNARAPREAEKSGGSSVSVIAIGASAGGTRAIERISCEFASDFPCVLVVQHIAKGFTDLFVNSLGSRCPMRVSKARDRDIIERGRMYVAPWGRHMKLVNDSGLRISLDDGQPVSGHKPSVDALFSSVAKAAGRNAIGVILTGMGRDGAAGLLEMREAGAATIGQDKDSSVVYGMPMEAFNIGAVQKQAPLDMITNEIKCAMLARRAV